jgi:hypothetical protein
MLNMISNFYCTKYNKINKYFFSFFFSGVAFGDPEKLLNATLFEMNYASWGRRVCSLCSQEDVAPEGETPPDEDLYQVLLQITREFCC